MKRSSAMLAFIDAHLGFGYYASNVDTLEYYIKTQEIAFFQGCIVLPELSDKIWYRINSAAQELSTPARLDASYWKKLHNLKQFSRLPYKIKPCIRPKSKEKDPNKPSKPKRAPYLTEEQIEAQLLAYSDDDEVEILDDRSPPPKKTRPDHPSADDYASAGPSNAPQPRNLIEALQQQRSEPAPPPPPQLNPEQRPKRQNPFVKRPEVPKPPQTVSRPATNPWHFLMPQPRDVMVPQSAPEPRPRPPTPQPPTPQTTYQPRLPPALQPRVPTTPQPRMPTPPQPRIPMPRPPRFIPAPEDPDFLKPKPLRLKRPHPSPRVTPTQVAKPVPRPPTPPQQPQQPTPQQQPVGAVQLPRAKVQPKKKRGGVIAWQTNDKNLIMRHVHNTPGIKVAAKETWGPFLEQQQAAGYLLQRSENAIKGLLPRLEDKDVKICFPDWTSEQRQDFLQKLAPRR